MKNLVCTIFVFAILFTACAPSPETLAKQTAVAATSTAAAWTPTPVPTPTPTPIPLSQIDLSKIALQSSDLISDFQMTKNSIRTEEQNVINFYSVSFGLSATGIGNVIRVFENETLASDFFQNDTKGADPNSQIEIPLLGDEAFAGKFDALGTSTVMIVWRYKEIYVFLRYASQDSTMQLVVAESIRLAQQIDARLKTSIP